MSEYSKGYSVGATHTPASGQPPPVFIVRLDQNEERPVDLASIVRFFWRNALLIAVFALLGGVLGFVWGRLATKVYRAQVVTSILSDTEESVLSSIPAGFAGLASLAGIPLGGGSNFSAEALALLRSRSFIEDFIRDEKLLPVLFARRWHSKEQRWLGDDPPPTLQDGYEMFTRKLLRITEDRKTGLVTLQLEWRNRLVAAQWANLLVERADRVLRRRAIEQADLAMVFLDKELQKTSVVELRQALFSAVERQTQKRMLATIRPEFAFRVVDPARASDERRYARPAKLMLLLAGLFAGGVAGTGIAMLVQYRKRSRAAQT
ncbi:MAG: hypothetical protein HC872_03965 [Gammaproteobacteria bacterium]|nr:hypothetical protein [Gammaproteobacteria bacterium]